MSRSTQGFTLIELMVVVVMIAIVATIAIPSYQEYVRRSNLAAAQQEMQKIAAMLERHRSRNFSYSGFALKGTADSKGPYYDVANASDTVLLLPLNSSSGSQKYTLDLSLDTSTNSWTIVANSQDPLNYSLRTTSSGESCKKKASSITNCNEGTEIW